jgi:hypothetical protein
MSNDELEELSEAVRNKTATPEQKIRLIQLLKEKINEVSALVAQVPKK